MAHWNTMALAAAIALGALLAAPAAFAECPSGSSKISGSPLFSASGTCKDISVSGTTVSAKCTVYKLKTEDVNASGDDLYERETTTCNSTSIDLDDHIAANDSGQLSWGGSGFTDDCDDIEITVSDDSLEVSADCDAPTSAPAARGYAEATLKNRAAVGSNATGGVLVAIPSNASTTPSVSTN